jgi:hypothetical protein
MNSYADLLEAGVSMGDAARQIAQETAFLPGKYARARHVLATRIAEAFDGPFNTESWVVVEMFGSMLAGLDTAEAAGITAEELEAAAPALLEQAFSEDEDSP